MLKPRIVARHNINLDREEIECILSSLASTGASSSADVDERRTVSQFEDDAARYHGVRRATATSSGRAAQASVMMALDLKPGSGVIVPAYSFYTVPTVVSALGFRPVFAPCDPATFAIDPARLERLIDRDTAAIIVEHPFGQPAPMDDILAICRERGIPVIEDASQSIGAELHGKKVGTFGRAACISLVHGKNMMTFGGGIVLTDDPGIAASVSRKVVEGGRPEKGETMKKAIGGLTNWALTTRPGFAAALFAPFYMLNAVDRRRLDGLFVEQPSAFDPSCIRPLSALQAALGSLQIKRLDVRNAIRRHNAERMLAGLADVPGLTLPVVVPGGTGTWNAVAVRVRDAADIQRQLMLRGIDTRADYMTLYAFEDEWNGAGQVFYLPNHPGMNDADVDYVIKSLRAVMNRVRS